MTISRDSLTIRPNSHAGALPPCSGSDAKPVCRGIGSILSNGDRSTYSAGVSLVFLPFVSVPRLLRVEYVVLPNPCRSHHRLRTGTEGTEERNQHGDTEQRRTKRRRNTVPV